MPPPDDARHRLMRRAPGELTFKLGTFVVCQRLIVLEIECVPADAERVLDDQPGVEDRRVETRRFHQQDRLF